MVKGRRSLSRAVKLGAFVVSLVLALAVPCMAFAATVVEYRNATPVPGSTISVLKPLIAVRIYDSNGVYGSANYSMTLDGVPVARVLVRLNSPRRTRFWLTYTPTSDLGAGLHTAAVRVKDLKGHISTHSWQFTVAGDGIAPVTTSDVVSNYIGSIHLFASDNVGVTATYYILDGGAQTAGTVITVTAAGPHLLQFWSVDAAGNVEARHIVFFTVPSVPPVPFVHATVTNSCTAVGSGCHSGNIAKIHAGGSNGGCANCHALSVAPMSDCTGNAACHATLPNFHSAATHKAIVSSATVAAQTCTQATCHGTSGLPIAYTHSGGCAECHDSTRAGVAAAILAGGATCESCHNFATIHSATAMATGHTVSGSCFASTCHGTNVATMHTIDFRGTGAATIPGCFACHAPGKTPSTDCGTCHSDLVTPHDFVRAHAGATASYTVNVTAMLSTNSSACVACHGNDLTKVMLVNPGTSGIPTSTTGADEHKGCSCHAYAEAGQENGLLPAGQAGCQNCHSGSYGAIHGWKVTDSKSFPGKWNVSGHNTPTFGTVGGRTDFSSLGVTDTVGAAPAAQFPLTVNNTFKTGYDWTSVVTCEDCHTGLMANEASGPHGGSAFANAGIDPSYSGSFESASLWGGQYKVKLANGTTYTAGPFAEGIAQWANTSADPEGLAGYQVVTPNMSDPTTTTVVAGPASVTAGNVICVKCHDLYDSTKTTGFKGWANYAHEHHSADTGSFKMIFGKYAVHNSSTNATTTVVAESAAAATATVSPYGDRYKEIVAASLGREDAGACRNCHIAIPHGWKRPKLIVYSNLPNPAGTTFRADKGLPATGDSAPYNIGPAVYEGEALNGTAIGSGQMNGLASGIVTFKEAQKDVNGSWVTSVTPYANLVIETENLPALVELNLNPLNGFTGNEYVSWSSAQCNACGHHSSTSFANPSATQPALTWNSRENNWGSTKPANGAWK